MRAMSEAEFLAEIGWGNNPRLIAQSLVAFLRSHDHHEVARYAETLEDQFERGDYYDEDDDYEPVASATPELCVSDGAGI